jgi:hypothetical protein
LFETRTAPPIRIAGDASNSPLPKKNSVPSVSDASARPKVPTP